MNIFRTLEQARDTTISARSLHALRTSPEDFQNADDFFELTPATDDRPRLLQIRGPFVEAVRPARSSSKTWIELCDELNIALALRDAVVEVIFGGDQRGRLYAHQEMALRLGLGQEPRGYILSVPTATGKTESFLLPILQHCLTNKPTGAIRLRAVLVYPTKTLESDQLNRMLRLVHAVNRRVTEDSRRIRIGIWDGDTPTALDGSQNNPAEGDANQLDVRLRVGDSVRGLECPEPGCLRNGHRPKLLARLPNSGIQLDCPNHPNRVIREISYVRSAWESKEGQADILVATPEAIDHALTSPTTNLRQALRRGKVRYLVYDEAHSWSGTGGVAIRHLNRRLLGLFRRLDPPARVLLASATVADPASLYLSLTGESGDVVAFQPTKPSASPPAISLPEGLEAVPLINLIASLASSTAAAGHAASTLNALGLIQGGQLTPAGAELAESIRKARSNGLTDDEVVTGDQAFREAWERVVHRTMPTLTEALWPDGHADCLVRYRPFTELVDRARQLLPEHKRGDAASFVEALLSYGRGAGIFVDRYHVFLIPPSGVFYAPDTRTLHAAPFDRRQVGAAGGQDQKSSPLPEVGICACGQPFIALVQGIHNEWLDREPLRSLFGASHFARSVMADPEEDGIYWPVGGRFSRGSDPYLRDGRTDRRLAPRVQGQQRQRCPACDQMLSPEMLRSAANGGFRFRAGYPRPARLQVENLVNYLLTAAVEGSPGRRVLAVLDGRNLAGRVGRNFLRDDTNRLGVASILVHHLLLHGPTTAADLHHLLHGEPGQGRESGQLRQRLLADVYAGNLPRFDSHIRRALHELVFSQAYLDRYRWLMLDQALIVPDVIDVLPDDQFLKLAAWELFARTLIGRPQVPLRLDAGDDEDDAVESDDDVNEDIVFVEDNRTRRSEGPRFVTRDHQRQQFRRRWKRSHLVGKTGSSPAELDAVFGQAFDLLVKSGFLRELRGDELQRRLLDMGWTERQQQQWMAQVGGTSLSNGSLSGAFIYESRQGPWLAAISRSRTLCQHCGHAWPGRFPLCWNCGNHHQTQMSWHNPVNQPPASKQDRLRLFLPPLIDCAARNVPAPLRTVESLRAGLDPVDRANIEDAFRHGRLNVLAATTLMELGIDIGKLDTLVLHGVPPTFTNYIQRSGRVGRTLGRPACVFNVLRPEHPVDMYYFEDLEGRFFRSLPPLHVPRSDQAPCVAAAHTLGHLFTELCTEALDNYKPHRNSPQEGTISAIRHALNYFVEQTRQKRVDLAAFLNDLGLSPETASLVLSDWLNAEGKSTPPVGSHRYRVEAYLKRVTQPGLNGAVQADMIRKGGNFPLLLSRLGLFGLYRGAGEQFPVRLRLGVNRYEIEHRSADQLFRECFPGPAPQQPGGLFYQGMTMWRIVDAYGEATAGSQLVPYCPNDKCRFCGTIFLSMENCPGCLTELVAVHTAEPIDVYADPLTNPAISDPRVLGITSSAIAQDLRGASWSDCGDLGPISKIEACGVVHAVPCFYDGLAKTVRPSRIQVANPLHSTEYIAGIAEVLPVVALRFPVERFRGDNGSLSHKMVWSCFTAFRKVVGVLLLREPGDYHALWAVDDENLYMAVADTHAGGTGLADQWHDLLRSDHGQGVLNRFSELANCRHCEKYCHYCLLHDRVSPLVVPHLNRRLLNFGFALP